MTVRKRDEARRRRERQLQRRALAAVQDVFMVDPKTGRMQPKPPGPSILEFGKTRRKKRREATT